MFTHYLLIAFVGLCGGGVHVTAHRWRSEHAVGESALAFYHAADKWLNSGARDWWQTLLPTGPSSPVCLISED